MSDDAAPDMALIARQQRTIIAELGSVRNDMAVLTAIAMRQDGTLSALLGEVRAMHARMANRIRDLESHT